MTEINVGGAILEREHPWVQILTDRCAGCQECVVRCPTGALSMEPERWVAAADSDLCVGCRQCVRTCPFSAVTVEGPMLVEPRVATVLVHPTSLLGSTSEIRAGFSGWDDALAEANRCLQCPDPTCVRGCPAHNDIPGFIGAIRDADLDKALDVLSRTTTLPDICSRVCNQSAQCEGACSWSLAGGVPVSIGRLERFVTDNRAIKPLAKSDAHAEGLSVAIIGSGPAGAGAAWELREAGASVTVYEKDATPGGLCVWGIPDFTLSEDLARRPWDQLVEAGVELHCDSEIHPEDVDALLERHDAVVVANGAGVPLRLTVPGSELEGVIEATSFLQGARIALSGADQTEQFLNRLGLGREGRGDRSPVVLVLGAGNTAMDVARSARRLGMGAICIDWLDERFALARPDELDEARYEGVDVRFARTLTALHGERRVARARLALTRQDRADVKPKVLSDTNEEVEVDLVVMAMGYRLDQSFAAVLPGTPIAKHTNGVVDRRWTASGILANRASNFANNSPVGQLAVGREVGLWTAAVPVSERLWVVGDALTGPATVVEAMAQGRRAAAAIIDARPARPTRDGGEGGYDSQRVLVCYSSAGGKTAQAAQSIADGFSTRGMVATVLPIAKVGARELAAADLIVVGSWVEGFVVRGVGPSKAMRRWLSALPRLGAKHVVVFCTFGFSPKSTLTSMRRALEAKGAVVVAQAAFGPKELDSPAGVFGPRFFGEQIATPMPSHEEAFVPAD